MCFVCFVVKNSCPFVLIRGSLNRLEERIRTILVKRLVRPHERHQILRVREINDIVRVARYHLHHLYLLARHMKLHDWIVRPVRLPPDPPQLDQPFAMHHDELLVLRVVPVLPFCNTRLGYIDRELTAIKCADDLRETAAGVHVHRHIVDERLRRQVAQPRGVQLLHQRVAQHGHLQCPPERREAFDGLRQPAELALILDGHVAEAVALTVRVTAHRLNQLLHHVVDIDQRHLHRRVVDLYRQPIGDVVAERRDGGIVVWTAPLTEDVREAIYERLHAVFTTVVEEQFLASGLALAVFATRETAIRWPMPIRTSTMAMYQVHSSVSVPDA